MCADGVPKRWICAGRADDLSRARLHPARWGVVGRARTLTRSFGSWNMQGGLFRA
jgi:hypothetical protein